MDRPNTSSRRWLECWPRPWVVAGSLALVAGIGVVDYLTGLELSVTMLYLIPVAVAAWYEGIGLGLVLAGASAAAWLAADWLERGLVDRPWVLAWNTLTLAGIYSVVAVILAALKRNQDGLEATVVRRTTKLREEVGQRRQAEEALRQANEELQRAQLRLIEAAKMEAIGRLAAGVAHEVKNPLMTLSMGTDYFLHRGPAGADEAVLLRDMKEAVHRASNIVNQLLDFSKPRPLQLLPEDINGIIENALGLVRHLLSNNRIQVVRELQPQLPAAPLDRTRVEHALVNLFTNAAHAMPAGGTLTVRSVLEAGGDAAAGAAPRLAVEVEDTGTGIPPEYLSKVFEPFFTTKPTGQGTGLGLAIVHSIVRIHGGAVSLDNRPGGGARATLKFNLEPQQYPSNHAKKAHSGH
jgi:signal transduction histidine kinase